VQRDCAGLKRLAALCLAVPLRPTLFVPLRSVFLVLLSSATASAGVTLLQVEAPDNVGRFAPVSFAAKSSAADVAYPGIRFFADSQVSTDGKDLSGHASQVGRTIFGDGAAGRSAVSSVRVMTSGDFLSRQLRPSPVASPRRLPGSPKFINASFAGSTGSLALDGELLRRLDILAARDGVFVAAGAVTSLGGNDRVPLMWAAQNVVAVRGASGDSVFNPGLPVPGRNYPDLWTDNTASVATASVTSAALSLSQRATQLRTRDGARPVVLRSLLLAGAERSAVLQGQGGWRRELSIGLDADLGAGKLSLGASAAILESGPVRFASVSRGNIAGTYRTTDTGRGTAVSERSMGFAYLSLRPGQTQAAIFELTEPITGLSASLAWNTSVRTGAVGSLKLELHEISLTSRGAAPLDPSPLLSLDVDGGNVRHLTSDQIVPAGLYAWVISNDGGEALTPGFAFRTGVQAAGGAVPTLRGLPGSSFGGGGIGSIPEPGSLLGVVVGVALLVRRPRRDPAQHR
jgi:hypothetical protein